MKTLKNVSARKTFEKNVAGVLVHIFNHATHHRGGISVYLDILGKENDYSSVLNCI
jgi:uncharacterized damage-inducible protein DinB